MRKFKSLVATAAFAATAAMFAEMPRSEWHALVSDCAKDAAVLEKTIVQLSAADQVAFLGEVNEAIAKMPGSNEARAAAILKANMTAIDNANTTNITAVLAEVFATVPTEYLPAVCEKFSTEVFSRSADGAQGMTDAQYAELAADNVTAVVNRVGDSDEGAVRATFAILMFTKASGGTPADLPAELAQLLPAGYRDAAANTWIPAATGKDGAANYDEMLGVASAGEEPDSEVVFALVGYMPMHSMLAEIAAGRKPVGSPAAGQASAFYSNPSAAMMSAYGLGAYDDYPDIGITRVPRTAISDEDSDYYSRRRGHHKEIGPFYPGQRTRTYGN